MDRPACRGIVPFMPEVSVVIPAHNPGSLLRRSLASVTRQTLTDLECIVVDDGSTQDLSWVEGFPDPRVHYVHQKNSGVSIARNVGVLQAKAPLVAFLDQDDEWHPNKLRHQMRTVAERPEAAFYYTDFAWVTGLTTTPASPAEVTYLGLLSSQHVCLSSVLIGSEQYASVGGHDPLFSQMQDYDLFLRLTMTFGDPGHTPISLVKYHLHGDNASADYATAATERTLLIGSHLRRARRLSNPQVIEAASRGLVRTRELYGYQAMDQVRAAIRDHRFADAGGHARSAAVLSPRVVARSARSWAMGRGSKLRGEDHDEG